MTTTYILNRVPLKSTPSTSYELWTNEKSNLDNLRPWGSVGFVYDTSYKYGKLGPRGKKCIFIWYWEHSKGYVLIGEQPDGRVTETESQDVDFIENEYPTKGEVNKDLELYELVDQDRDAPSSLVKNVEEISQSPRDSGNDLPPSGSTPLEEDS